VSTPATAHGASPDRMLPSTAKAREVRDRGRGALCFGVGACGARSLMPHAAELVHHEQALQRACASGHVTLTPRRGR
jgi:hypothetical protein